MVAVGLGGKLIRTVSFFGCTLAASAGLGGTPPGGGFGLLSAIKRLVRDFKLGLSSAGVKLLFPQVENGLAIFPQPPSMSACFHTPLSPGTKPGNQDRIPALNYSSSTKMKSPEA